MSFWTAGAVVGSSVLGGIFGGKASKNAANAQQQATQASIDEQKREYDLARSDFAPYRQAGTGALNSLQQITFGNGGKPDYSSFLNSPGYQFQRDEGTRGINNQFAARGGAASGNAMRALTQFSSGLAASDFANYWNRVKGVADIGLGATGGTTAAGTNAANNTSNALMAGGDARASGIMGNANSWNNAINSGLNTYLLQQGGYFNKPNSPRNVEMWDASYKE